MDLVNSKLDEFGLDDKQKTFVKFGAIGKILSQYPLPFTVLLRVHSNLKGPVPTCK